MKTNILIIFIFYNLISPTKQKSSSEQQLSNERLTESVEVKTPVGEDEDNADDGMQDDIFIIEERQEDGREKMPDREELSGKVGAADTVPLKDPQYKLEVEAGDHADMFGTNEHKYVPTDYRGYGRRFVLQYPYEEKESLKNKSEDNKLKPVKASPALVLAVAKQSALLETSKPADPTYQRIQKDILRSGNYWDGIWKEDVLDPTKSLRINKDYSHERRKEKFTLLKPVKVKIMPGSYLYRLVSETETKNISPRLLYIINNIDDRE